MYKKPIED